MITGWQAIDTLIQGGFQASVLDLLDDPDRKVMDVPYGTPSISPD
jgi:hypothetical protein